MSGGERIEKKKLIVSLPGRELELSIAADFEALITDVSDGDKVPCWADLWPAAYGLAYFIWDSVEFAPGESVMELGAGMGLPGIVCGLKGAELTLSDFNPLALGMAYENARKNGISARLLQEDWRSFTGREKYDYILASDILYDPKLNPFLGEIFRNNLKSNGKVIISHPEREATYDFLERWYDEKFFSREKFIRVVELKDSLLKRYLIVIHVLTSRQGS